VAYEPDTSIGGAHHGFPTTRPTLLEAAAGDGTHARDALDEVIALYWKPVYKHARIQWKRSNEEAKDLVQGFFASLIGQATLAKYDPARGRLRSYLRACLDHYAAKQDESAGRIKRGGGLILNFDEAEREIAAAAPSPDDVFLREWRREVFARALDELRALAVRLEKEIPYRIFEQYDLCESERPSYAELAAEHGIAVTSVTNHLAWARRELRRLVAELSDRV
jgi:RNA polymerase sigma factor (sigma-70 family)